MRAGFTIQGRLPGMNDVIRKARANRFLAAKEKKEQQDRVRWEIRAARMPKFTGPVQITVSWFEPNARRDLDGLLAGLKPLLDAVVAEGIIPDDSRKHLQQLVNIFPDPDPIRPRVEVTIETIDTGA